MSKINMQICENGFQNSAYNNPKIPIYIKKGNLSLFDYRFKPHWHNDFEVIRVLDGEMKYNIDGDVTTVDKDNVLFVNSNRMHFGYSDSMSECNYICLVFDFNLLCSNKYIRDNYILRLANDEGCPYLLIKNKELNKIIDKLCTLKNDLSVQSCLYDIFLYVFEEYKKAPKNKIEKMNFSKIRQMIDYINFNYHQKITLNDIAKAGNVSKSTCINYFKENLNRPPIEYLIDFRLEKSTELLLNTDLSITQAANEVGFSSSSHYCELFKRKYNVTPSEVKKRRGL